MKKFISIIASLLLAQSIHAIKINGWIEQSYIKTTENKVSENNLDGTEVGLKIDHNFAPGLDFRSLLSHEPAYKDKKPTEFNYFLLDGKYKINNVVVGSRIGRLQVPYGFYNETRLDPTKRISVEGRFPYFILWPQNSVLFDYTDGKSFYIDLFFTDLNISFEYLEGTRFGPLEPQIDYVQNLKGIIPHQQNQIFRELKLDYKNFEFIFLYVDHETLFRVTEDHYRETLPAPYNELMPVELFPIGDYGIHYVSEYYGARYFIDKFMILYEKLLFHYTGTGNADEWYDFWEQEIPIQTNYHSNFLAMYIDGNIYTSSNVYEYYVGYSELEDSESLTHVNRYVGFNYKDIDNKLIYKFTYSMNDDTQSLSWKENPDKLQGNDNVKRNWELYGASIVYYFTLK